MKKTISLIFVFFFLIGIVSATTWVNDPNDCPTTSQSQTCSGSDVVCGLNGGITYCYNPSSLIPPSGSASSTTSYSSSFNGGYILDCDYYDGSAPNCDNSGNFWCDRSETCYSTQYRNTLCTADTWGTATCGTCRTNYFNCYGDSVCEATSTSDCQAGTIPHTKYNTATCDDLTGGGTCMCDTGYYICDGTIEDGDGCEIQTGGSCSSGTGTYSGSCYGLLGDCTSSTNSDCDNDDTDADLTTCNGANGCEITGGGSCGSGTGTYVNSQCSGYSGNCTSAGTNLDCNEDDSDSNLLTCNGDDGCEVVDGGVCTVGTLSGTYDGCSCVVTQSNFKTGNETSYSTDDALIWGSQYGSGYLINMTNGSEMRFGVNNSGCVVFPDSTTQCTGTISTNFSNVAYYNQSNTFSENQTFSKNITVTDTGFFGWLGSLVNRITGLFVQDINFNGTINGTGNITTTGRIGIGTSNPSTTLDVNGNTTISEILNVSNAFFVHPGTLPPDYNPRVAIGTDNTTGLLSVIGQSDPNEDGSNIYIQAKGSTDTSIGFWNIGSVYIGAGYWSGSVDEGAYPSIKFGMANPTTEGLTEEWMTIIREYGGSKLGIGSTNPTQKLDVNGSTIIRGNLSVTEYYYGDGSQLTGISTYNATYNTWAYNQTTPAIAYTYSVITANNASWSSTYNSTYDAKADYQFGANNFNGSGNITTTGNVTAGYFIGDGSQLTGIADTTGSWTNTSTTASTDLNVNLTTGNLDISAGRVGIGKAASSSVYTLLDLLADNYGYLKLRATNSNKLIQSALVLSSDAYRGKGILMEDTSNTETWYAGTPYFSRNYQIGYFNASLAYNGIGGGENASRPENAFMTIDTSGDVGIGTASPTQKLDVNGNVNISGSYYGNGNITLGNDGQIGLGNDLSSEVRSIKLRSNYPDDEVNAGTIAYRANWATNSLSIVGAGNTTQTTRNVRIFDSITVGYSVPNEGTSIAVSGDVGIGTDNPQASLHVYSTINETVLRLEDADGTCLHNPEAGSETVSCSSDKKLKDNIKDATPVLDELDKIKVRDYTIKASGVETTGAIAQEMMETNPEMVHEENGELFVEQPNPWKLLKAIQELSQRIDALVGGNYSVQVENINQDSAGTSRVLVNETEVYVEFDSEFSTEPIVIATPIGLPNFFYGVDEITTKGFKILISESQEKEVIFNWHASGKISNSKIDYNQTLNESLELNISASENETLDVNITVPEISENISSNETLEIPDEDITLTNETNLIIPKINENTTESNMTLNETIEVNESENLSEEIFNQSETPEEKSGENETLEEDFNDESIIKEIIEEEDMGEENSSFENPLTGAVVGIGNSESKLLKLFYKIKEWFK